MLSDVILIAAGAGVGGLFVGALVGAWFANKRLRGQVEEIGEEVARLTRTAEDKLLEDDPDLPDLLRELNNAVEKTHRAVDALENQSELTKQKTAAAKDIAGTSRRIMAMMEDIGADMPHVPAPKKETLSAAPAETKAPPSLR